MQILIDARCVEKNLSGISRHAVSIVTKIFEIDNTNRYKLLVRNCGINHFHDLPENVELIVADIRPYTLKEQLVLPQILKKIDYDLYYTPNYTAPLFIHKPIVFTIHDLIHLIFHQHYTVFHRIYYMVIIKKLVMKAKFIFTVSESTKKDIIKFFDVPDEKIIVNYNGVSEGFNPGQKNQAKRYVRERFGITGSFVLWVGNDKPHKNLEGVLKAFNSLLRVNPSISLVCVGSKKIDEIKSRSSQRIFNPVPNTDEDLINLYRSAELLVVPSLYEGFCLPVLEAFACGCPVVTSNTSSLPEIAGDAALLINPEDPEEISMAMEKILKDQVLREELIRKGIERAGQFSWRRAAEKVLFLIEKF